MNDLDSALRSVARALVDAAPPPPPFPSGTIGTLSPTHRPLRRYAVAAAAAAAVAGTGAALLAGPDTPRIVASGAEPSQPAATRSPLCDGDPRLRVTVPAATHGPTDGPAANTPPLADGQRAIHWTTAEGSVDLRWPGRQQPIYDERTSVISTLSANESVSAGRAEIDITPMPDAADAGTTFRPDVVLESRGPGSPEPTPPCDLLELTVITRHGRWHTGLRAISNGELGQPAERVDLQPRIIERRPVDVAPRAAIRCQGADRHGTPPNRSGGADPAISGPRPADVLLAYLAATPGAPSSGYVEMVERDGSITYGVDPSGIGWTTLLFVARAGDGWYLEGWNASGC